VFDGHKSFRSPYKWVCSKCKFSDIYQQPFNSCIYAICVKLLQHALLIFTSIPQLRLLMVHHAFPMSKLLGCFPCSNCKKKILLQGIAMKECLWLSSLEIWKFLILFTWVQLGNYTMRNSNLKKCCTSCSKSCWKFFLCLNFFGIMFSLRYFVFCM